MTLAALDKDTDELRERLEGLGLTNIQFDSSYGFIVGVLAEGSTGRRALTTRNGRHPRGYPTSVEDWVEAFRSDGIVSVGCEVRQSPKSPAETPR